MDAMHEGRYYRWHVARQKVRWIKQQIAEGRTVYLCTYTKTTKITVKQLPLVFAVGVSGPLAPGLYVRHGKQSLCYDHAAIRAN